MELILQLSLQEFLLIKHQILQLYHYLVLLISQKLHHFFLKILRFKLQYFKLELLVPPQLIQLNQSALLNYFRVLKLIQLVPLVALQTLQQFNLILLATQCFHHLLQFVLLNVSQLLHLFIQVVLLTNYLLFPHYLREFLQIKLKLIQSFILDYLLVIQLLHLRIFQFTVIHLLQIQFINPEFHFKFLPKLSLKVQQLRKQVLRCHCLL